MHMLTPAGTYESLGHLRNPLLNNPTVAPVVPHVPNIWGVRRAIATPAPERSEVPVTQQPL